ncbi:MAG: c-type cytochrome [Acidobacteria bacterium]|nr:c-type cytochrome [Acidobacteriota bacterium]
MQAYVPCTDCHPREVQNTDPGHGTQRHLERGRSRHRFHQSERGGDHQPASERARPGHPTGGGTAAPQRQDPQCRRAGGRTRGQHNHHPRHHVRAPPVERAHRLYALGDSVGPKTSFWGRLLSNRCRMRNDSAVSCRLPRYSRSLQVSKMSQSWRGRGAVLATVLFGLAVLAGPFAISNAEGQTVGRAGSSAGQEGQLGIPQTPRNLQILPADMSTRAVIGVMRGMTGALGTRCTHCHVGDNPRDLSTVDFASDEKETKRVARVMMQMVGNLNDDLLRPGLMEAGRAEAMEVTCQTCHRGNTRPVRLQDVLAERHESEGTDSMMELYEELYERHYGSAVYDFSEGSLIRTAGRLARAGDVEAGQALIDRNLELYPTSINTYFSWGQTLEAAGENERARASWEKCLELNPAATWCQNAINGLDQ